MAGINKAMILGRLGRDPETTTTQGGLTLCKFSIATSKKKKDGTEITSWHRCTAFGKTGELIAQYVGKGDELFVEGSLSYGEYEKNGNKVYTTDIIVDNMNFVGSRKQNTQHGYNNQQRQGNQEYTHQRGNGYNQQPISDINDDIPF